MATSEHLPSGQVTLPSDLSSDYYDFPKYVSPERMLTYWHQIVDVMNTDARNVIEVGLGAGVVAAVLRHNGVSVKTVDINPELGADFVSSVLQLSTVIPPDSTDLVLCARVLHHLEFSRLEEALLQMSLVTRRHVLLTLPVDDLRIYLGTRLTSTRTRWATIPLPVRFKPALKKASAMSSDYDQLWKVGSSRSTSPGKVDSLIQRHFDIERRYHVPSDRSHLIYMLRKR